MEFPHNEYDPDCSPHANCDHMRYLLEGYRARTCGAENDNPYSPRSARAESWKRGFEQADKDLGK